ncbi:MAG TPA: carboxylesterase family protein [Bryobacteraceae bacterium]|nr:carboxylesterase family protein [Bryobacteraceae bacterium]
MRILVLAGAGLVVVSAYAVDPTVTVTGGAIVGRYLKQDGAVFKGVPFAQPPVGELRWRPPVPVKAWKGPLDAGDFSPPCAQNAAGRMLAASREDCLYLNVWTPEWPSRAPKPVMLWIHGGGNYAGTASSASFDGEALARHGVVVVTANYRLTIFGFFAHPELTRESPHHASGNYGLMDQIAALEWIRDNIAKFGGDAGNVTVFGQSAGAVDANVLMTSPRTRGLFQRVIAESGTVTRNPDAGTLGMTALGAVMRVKQGELSYSDAAELREAEQSGKTLAGSDLKALRAIAAADLLALVAAPQKAIGPANGVIVDGYVLPRAPAEVFAHGRQHRLALLIGNNSRERTPPQTTPEEVTAAMNAMYGPLAPRALMLYPLNGSADPLYGSGSAQWVVDTMYRCPVVAQLLWQTAASAGGYEYQFDHAPPGREALGSTHGAEVPYVFGSLGPQYTEADRELSATIERYWTNFAKTGDPNGPGLQPWPKFDAFSRDYLEFTAGGPAAREGLRRPFCDLYVENVQRLMAH